MKKSEKKKSIYSTTYFRLSILLILAVFVAGINVGRTFAVQEILTASNEFCGKQQAPEIPSIIDDPQVPMGPFDPQDNPKTADSTEIKAMLAGLAICLALLKQTVFGRKRW